MRRGYNPAARGLAGARTDEIAAAAQVNKAVLYYYFRDKERLYRAVLEKLFGALSELGHPLIEIVSPEEV